MKLLEKRWVLIVLIIFLFLLVYGSAFLLYSELLSLGLYIVVNIFLFSLVIYFLYRLINLSRWGGRKPWKKMASVVAISTLFLVVSHFSFVGILYLARTVDCYQRCGDEGCCWSCREPDILLPLLEEYTPEKSFLEKYVDTIYTYHPLKECLR